MLFRSLDESIDAVLRRRGQLIVGTGKITQTLLPAWCVMPTLEHEPEQLQQFRTYFAHSSFRKVARTLTAAHGSPVPSHVLTDIAPRKVPDYLRLLGALKVIGQDNATVRLITPIDNIGPTLEWYVADLCERELRGSAAWSVQLEGLAVGGDYDVLAWLPPTLVHIECKSSPAAHVTVDQFHQFRRRDEVLAPDLSVMLIDTDDDLAGLLERITGFRPVPDYPGVNWGFRHLYIINAKGTIFTQIRRCLQHYHAEVRRRSFYG